METLGDFNSLHRKANLLYKLGSNCTGNSPLRYHTPLIPRSPTPPKSMKMRQSVSPNRDSYYHSTFGSRRMSASLPITQYIPDLSYSTISRDIMQFTRQHEVEGVVYLNKEISSPSYRHDLGNRSQKKHLPYHIMPKKNFKHRRGQSIDSHPIIRWSATLHPRT